MIASHNSESENISYVWSKSHTSLRKWRLGSFKSINEVTEVDLAPLTVVVGANSAGKSSLIQSILLMAQNAVSAFRLATPQLRGDIELNSYLVQLGTMKETVCDFDTKKNRKFSLELGGLWYTGERAISHYEDRIFPGNMNSRIGPTIEKGLRGLLLDWETEFIPSENNKDSGIATVHESHANLLINGLIDQKVSARARRQLPGFEVARSKYEKFSFDHSSTLGPSKEALVKEASEDEHEPYREENDAVCFRSALPVSGLKLVNIIDYIFEHQTSLYYEDREREYKIEISSFNPSGEDLSEKVFESIDAAAEAFLSALTFTARAILQQDQVADDLDINLLSARVEAVPFIAINRIPFKYLQQPTSIDLFENRKTETDTFLALVKTKLKKEFSNAEWIEKNVLCAADGRRTRDPIYKNSKIASVIELWNRYLSESVLYLGPLRAAPKATYGLGSGIVNSNIPIGESGEYLAKTLFSERILKRYPILENGELRPQLTTLEKAVSQWYQELCISPDTNDSIEVDAPGRQGYQLNIGERTLANVGFGVSQILPVIAICLMAAPGSLVLLEQPELHLNPGMQQKLADFLLHMAKTGRQIIVETHSEYLITRLRRNAAINSDDHKYFGIIFAERDPKTGTHYRPVNVNEHGDLSEWPKGFFDQVADDLRALMRKAAERKAIEEDS